MHEAGGCGATFELRAERACGGRQRAGDQERARLREVRELGARFLGLHALGQQLLVDRALGEILLVHVQDLRLGLLRLLRAGHGEVRAGLHCHTRGAGGEARDRLLASFRCGLAARARFDRLARGDLAGLGGAGADHAHHAEHGRGGFDRGLRDDAGVLQRLDGGVDESVGLLHALVGAALLVRRRLGDVTPGWRD
jgi:hypothetical protein